MPRLLESPLGYPEALAELWMGDHREDLDNLRDHYLRRVAQLGIVPDRCRLVHRQDAAERDASSGLFGLLFQARSARRAHPLDVMSVGVFKSADAWVLLRLFARERGAPLCASDGACGSLRRRDEAEVSARVLRGPGFRSGSKHSPGARIYRREV